MEPVAVKRVPKASLSGKGGRKRVIVDDDDYQDVDGDQADDDRAPKQTAPRKKSKGGSQEESEALKVQLKMSSISKSKVDARPTESVLPRKLGSSAAATSSGSNPKSRPSEQSGVKVSKRAVSIAPKTPKSATFPSASEPDAGIKSPNQMTLSPPDVSKGKDSEPKPSLLPPARVDLPPKPPSGLPPKPSTSTAKPNSTSKTHDAR